MPIASKSYAEFEVERTNETLGTNLVLGKSESGYTIHCDESRTSEINCCMKYRDVISALTTMRSLFPIQKFKESSIQKIQTDKQNDVYFGVIKTLVQIKFCFFFFPVLIL